MTGISGFKSPELPTLPIIDTPAPTGAAPDIKSYDLAVPGPLPDTEHLSPEEIFDVFSGFVEDFGSQELKDALAAGQKIELQVYDDAGKFLGTAQLDGEEFIGSFSCATGNPTIGMGGAGSGDPTLCANALTAAPQDNTSDNSGTLPVFLRNIFSMFK